MPSEVVGDTSKTVQFSPTDPLGCKFNGTLVAAVKSGFQAEALGVQVGWNATAVQGHYVNADNIYDAIDRVRNQGQHISVSFEVASATGTPASGTPGGVSRGASAQDDSQTSKIKFL